MRSVALATALLILGNGWALGKKKKTDEELTQKLEILKDPPAAVTAETQRLVFHVSPLSAKGLLSQQVRDALKALAKSANGAQTVKLRAFVAGSGDLRRVQAIVSETYTERKLALPALSVVQVGGLPMEGAQVVIESIAVAKKAVNPHGLLFVSGQGASNQQPLGPVSPLVERSLADLDRATGAYGVRAADVLRVTCFVSSLQDVHQARGKVLAHYPAAAFDIVQTQRAPMQGLAECEAVARLAKAPPQAVALSNPPGLNASPNFSHLAAIAAPRLALTGTQSSYGFEEADARLAFQRLQRALESVGASYRDVVMSGIYPVAGPIRDQVSKIRFEFYDRARPPASTMLLFEGLPSMDAGFAVDVVAIPNK